MFRADRVRGAARLPARPPVVEAIATHRILIATASPARLIEEYYKMLRSGAAEKTFRVLAEHGLLEPITPETAPRREERGAVGGAGRARSLSAQVRDRAADAHQPGAARHAAGAARPDAAQGGAPLGRRRRGRRGDGDAGRDPALPRSRSRFRRPPKEPIAPDRRAAGRAPRHRAAAADAVAAAPARGPRAVAARQARADAPRAVSGRADVARDSRPARRRCSNTGTASSKPLGAGRRSSRRAGRSRGVAAPTATRPPPPPARRRQAAAAAAADGFKRPPRER